MKCRRCEYALWNLPARRCPECGEPFRPSEFEFVPGTVAFRCPHCEQAYFGTDARGQLSPREFDCASCGTHVDVDEMVLAPAPGVEEWATRVEKLPWAERKRLGAVRGWLRTIGMALVRPGRLGRVIPETGSVADALWFAVLTTGAVAMGYVALPLVVIGVMMLTSAGAAAGTMLLGMSVLGVVGFVAMMLMVLIWGAAAHALICITGPRRGGLGHTLRALAYSTGANVVSAVPCLGFYVGWIWWWISAVITVKEHQRIGGARAAFAVLTFPVLGLGGLIAIYAVLVAGAVAAAGVAATIPAPVAPGVSGISHIGGELLAFQRREGTMPAHALALVTGNSVTPKDLLLPGTATDPERIAIGTVTLAGYQFLSAYEREVASDRAAALLAPGTVAHRLGDYVFVYHGIEPAQAQPGLWLVVAAPDPSFTPVVNQRGLIDVFDARGVVSSFPEYELPARLEAQNQLRGQYGLAPLPDLSTVGTRGAPAGP